MFSRRQFVASATVSLLATPALEIPAKGRECKS